MEYFRTEQHNRSFPPKPHMLEDYATDWKTGFGIYGKQSAKGSIHNEFNQSEITYCRMQPSSRLLESMLSQKQSCKFKN